MPRISIPFCVIKDDAGCIHRVLVWTMVNKEYLPLPLCCREPSNNYKCPRIELKWFSTRDMDISWNEPEQKEDKSLHDPETFTGLAVKSDTEKSKDRIWVANLVSGIYLPKVGWFRRLLRWMK